jgi:subtilisin-like proprotein convertase family protein
MSNKCVSSGLLIFILFAATSIALGSEPPPGTWFAWEASASPGDPARVESVATAPAEVRIDLVVPGLESRVVETRGGPRGLLEVPGAGVTGALGHPRLPALRYMVEMPPGAEVFVSLTPASVSRMSLETLGIESPLIPVQPPVPKIEGAAERAPFVEEVGVYASDRFLPAESVQVVDRAVLRGRHVAVIEVRPVRYNPADGSVEVWSRAELRVAFEGGVPQAALREKLRLASPALDGWIEREIVARPDSIASDTSAFPRATSASEGAAGMLVIVHDDFVGALQPFVDWKEKTGFKIEVLATSQIDPSPTDSDVKAEIDQRYRSWSNPPLEFVLMVGDTNYVPIHNGTGGGSSQVTDNWFVCLDGTDYLPELAIARISTRSPQQTTDVVDKLLTYEQATFATDIWIKKAGFIGTADTGHITLIEGTHDWCIDNYYTPNEYLPTPWSHGYASCDRHYYTTNATTADIAASIDEGRSMVNYSGHGSTTGWQGPTYNAPYNQSDVNGNSNDGMYPFVISNACVTGSLELTECFGETWQRAPHKGAIAFWGASNNSYWDEDDVLQRDLHDNIFPMDETPPLGVIVNETKLDLYDHYGPTGSVAYYFDMYNLLSEPSLSMWTRVPMDLDVTYPDAIPIGQSSFSVTVMYRGHPVSDAMVAVRKPDERVFEAGYTDETGQITLLFDPAPTTVGDMEVTVTGHDLRPHEGTSMVISPDTPWLIYSSHVVDDTGGGDGDGTANPGEVFVMPVTVENVGGQPGTGLQATLTTSTPQWCTVLDGAADFPDLLPGELGETLPDHYSVHVSELAPDGVSLGFELAWSASGGASGVSSFGTVVEGVNFELDAFAIDDVAHGNGNGMAGPGETVDMTVTLSNTGLRDASGITSQLSTDSPHITILQDTAAFPDLPASGQADSLPPPFEFFVAEDAPDQQPVTFTLTVSEAGSGYQEVLLFDVMISSCATTPSVDVPKPITDYTVVESLIDYPLAILLNEVNVFVDISHTYQGDLTVRLESPSGTSVLLHNRTGGGADDIVTWYDTQTEPTEPLSILEGENAYGTWKLIVEDHAGADQGTLNDWSLEICGELLSQDAALLVTDFSLDDVDACDPDGVADIGETVTWNVTVRNEGWGPATGVRAWLSTPSDVIVLNNPVPLPDLAHGEQAQAQFQTLIMGVECKELAQFTVDLEADQGVWSDGFVTMVEADFESVDVWENLEHQGAEPAGWTHSDPMGGDDWQVVNDRDHTMLGVWSWFASDAAYLKDDRLVSPPFDLGVGNPSLRFWHWVDLQDAFDGGVLEISIDNGQSWTDLGPDITTGGYDGTLFGDNPIAGRSAWTGWHDEWREVVVDLTPWAEQTALFRWRLTCDSATAGNGWWVDDIIFHMDYELCDAHLCGVPGEVTLTQVSKQGEDVLLEWRGDMLCIDYGVWRASDPTSPAGFADVTVEDPDPTDTLFLDTSGGDLLYWIVIGHGPEGDGPWGHYEF